MVAMRCGSSDLFRPGLWGSASILASKARWPHSWTGSMNGAASRPIRSGGGSRGLLDTSLMGRRFLSTKTGTLERLPCPAIRTLKMLGGNVSSRQRQTSIELAAVDGPEAEGDALLGTVFAKQMGKYPKCFLRLPVFQPDGNRQASIADFDIDMRPNRDVARYAN